MSGFSCTLSFLSVGSLLGNSLSGPFPPWPFSMLFSGHRPPWGAGCSQGLFCWEEQVRCFPCPFPFLSDTGFVPASLSFSQEVSFFSLLSQSRMAVRRSGEAGRLSSLENAGEPSFLLLWLPSGAVSYDQLRLFRSPASVFFLPSVTLSCFHGAWLPKGVTPLFLSGRILFPGVWALLGARFPFVIHALSLLSARDGPAFPLSFSTGILTVLEFELEFCCGCRCALV